MTTEIRPALTPEQWRDEHWYGASTPLSVEGWVGNYPERLSIYLMDEGRCCECPDPCPCPTDAGHELTPGERHATAALCLYGQPFGFTREDVEALSHFGTASLAVAEPHPRDPTRPFWERAKRIDSIAARIEALLPPESDAPQV